METLSIRLLETLSEVFDGRCEGPSPEALATPLLPRWHELR